MLIVHDTDKYKYYDKQKRVDLIKYSNGVKTVYNGSAIYLPWRFYDGDELFDNIVKFVSNNSDHKTYRWCCWYCNRRSWKDWNKYYRCSQQN